mmetsp:Transcript_42673/g.100307  ORF Transcript_42673/g.100307 Transcript_42673/m.100307 type:complete len:146 (+) Transcript_42673:83-520(+)|eukprot:1193558-Rhodomonas_salina.2
MSRLQTSLPTTAMTWLSLTQANTNFDVAEPPVTLGSRLRHYPNVTKENRNRPPMPMEEISRVSQMIDTPETTESRGAQISERTMEWINKKANDSNMFRGSLSLDPSQRRMLASLLRRQDSTPKEMFTMICESEMGPRNLCRAPGL